MLNLAQLDTLVSISPEAFPKRGHFDARRALARIAQAKELPLSTILAAAAPALLEEIKETLPGKEFWNVRPNLARALEIDPLPIDVLERIRLGEPTLADALLAAERQPTLATTGRVPGALKLFAEKLQLRPEQIPALLGFVDEKFAAWSPTLLDMEDKNFANFRWRVRRGVGLVDLAARQQRKLSLLSGAWAELVSKLRPEDQSRAGKRQKRNQAWLGALAPLVAYCERHDIGPDAVCDDTISALHADLALRRITDPLDTTRRAVYAWEALQRSVPDFPQQTLARIYKQGFGGESVHKDPYRDLPEAFRSSFEDYVSDHFGAQGLPASMAELIPDADDDISFVEMAETLDDTEPRPRRRDGAVKNFRTVLTYAANAALAAGAEPQSVFDVATTEILARVLDAIWARQRERGKTVKKNSYLYNACTILLSVARDGGAPKSELERMMLMRDKVDPHFIKYAKGVRRDGTIGTIRVRADWKIGPRHEARLKQFNDPFVFKSWFQLPYRLLAKARKAVATAQASKSRLGPEIINDAIVVLYHGVARCAPVRRENFAQLRFDGREIHLDLPETAGEPGYIVIPAPFTKNGKQLTIQLNSVVADWFRFWMTEVRPHCQGAIKGNPYVFPSDAGGHRDAGDINNIFVHRNWKRGGFKLNTQVCRHLSAKIILDADPGQMGLVQTLLGHKSLKTTETYYGRVNQIIAQRWYQEALAKAARDIDAELL